MKKSFLITSVCALISISSFAYDERSELVLTPTPQSNVSRCMAYSPLMGVVKEGQDLKVNSDQFEFTDNKNLILDGNVTLDFAEGLLKAQNANLDRDNGKIQFFNGGEIFLTDFYFRAENGFFNKKDTQLSLFDGQAYLDERGLIFGFESLDGQLNNIINLTNTTISSCADPNKGWVIKAKDIRLNTQTNRGSAKSIKLKVMGKTILALPQLPFATSTERMSGFLEPSLSFSSDGADITLPYYKVLSSSSDITIAPRVIAKRGQGLELNFRSLHGENRNLRNLDLIYFNKDNEYEKEGYGSNSPRWGFNILDTFEHRSTKINLDWSKVSDSLFLRDIPGDITSIGYQRIQNLSQNFSLSKTFKNASIEIKHQGYQTLNPVLTNGYKKSPSITFDYSKNLGKFFLSEQLNISSFKASSIHGYFGNQDAFGNYPSLINNPAEGSRIYSDLSLQNHGYIRGINIVTNVGIKSIKYSLSDNSQKTNDVNVPNAFIDVSSIFMRAHQNNKYFIEPRLFIGYTGYEDQSNNPIFDTDELSMNNELFNNLRFSGMDRIGDQKFYTLSLKYKKMIMGMEKLSVSVSKKYFLADRKVWMHPMLPGHSMSDPSTSMESIKMDWMPMDRGPTTVMGKWMPNKRTMLMAYGGYFNKNKKIPLGGLTLKHDFNNGSIGIAKRYRRLSGDFNFPMNYSEIFGDIKISSKFKVIAKLKHDDEINKNIESIVGIEYENCCFALRVTGSDRNLSKYINKDIYYPHLAEAWDNIIQIENKGRINFEFELKGFNSSPNKINRLLNNSLFNY